MAFVLPPPSDFRNGWPAEFGVSRTRTGRKHRERSMEAIPRFGSCVEKAVHRSANLSARSNPGPDRPDVHGQFARGSCSLHGLPSRASLADAIERVEAKWQGVQDWSQGSSGKEMPTGAA